MIPSAESTEIWRPTVVTPRVRRRIIRWKAEQLARYGRREMPLRSVVRGMPVIQRLVPGLCVAHGALYMMVKRGDGTVEDYGLVGRHLITTAAKNAFAGAFNNVAPEPELFKFHAFGTGTNSPAVGDTALQTEATTAYAPDNTRVTGTQGNSANTYTTVGTFTPDAAIAVTEWALMSQAATGGGTCLDRQTFAVQNLNGSTDSLQVTYVLTFS